MNLETFKARARRKLELRNRSSQVSPVHPAPKYSGLEDRSDQKTGGTLNDTAETNTKVETSETSSREQDRTSSSTTMGLNADDLASGKTGVQSLTGSPVQPLSTGELAAREKAAKEKVIREQLSEDIQDPNAQLDELRSLLLGTSFSKQTDQIEGVYQRTQYGIDALRADMDTRLTDLTKYIGQLEQSILNNIESKTDHAEGSAYKLLENTEERLKQHEQRLDAMDSRLSRRLTDMNDQLEKNRSADQKLLRDEIAESNARTDRLLHGLTDRLEASIKGIEQRLDDRLKTQTAGFAADSEANVGHLREQLGNLIDQRIKTFNAEQSSGLLKMRDTLLSNTKSISAELKQQTEQQRNTLRGHRTALETQFNEAIKTLSASKVSHKDLSDLLSRLADRVTRL